MSDKFEIANYFNLEKTAFPEIFSLEGVNYPWDILERMKTFILGLSEETLKELEYRFVRGHIWVHKETILPSDLDITGPVLIGKNCSIRSGARIRPNTIIGDHVNIGNGVEIKNSFLFSNVEIPHAGVYVGNAIIGNDVYISPNVIFANRYDPLLNKGNIIITLKDSSKVELKDGNKFSALVGDGCQINPNAVINAGSLLEKNVSVLTLALVKGFVPKGYIVKRDSSIVKNNNLWVSEYKDVDEMS